VTGSVDWTLGGFGAAARGTYYGDVVQPGTVVANDIHTGRKTIFDLEARYQINRAIGVAIGGDNLFDTYPYRTPSAINSTGAGGFPYYSPFGYNGRYLYGRINLSW